MDLKPITWREAKLRGMEPMTTPYLTKELPMLERASNQLGKIQHVIVSLKTSKGPGWEIWKPKHEIAN